MLRAIWEKDELKVISVANTIHVGIKIINTAIRNSIALNLLLLILNSSFHIYINNIYNLI
jgi:hypothetical protein